MKHAWYKIHPNSVGYHVIVLQKKQNNDKWSYLPGLAIQLSIITLLKQINPCHAEFIWGNIDTLLPFPSFLNIQMVKSVKILPRKRQRPSWSHIPWWCHQMETFSALLTLCAGNSPVTSEFSAQRTSDTELWYFLWSAPEQTDEYTIEMPVIRDAIMFIMMLL